MKFKSILGVLAGLLVGALPVLAAFNDISLSSGATWGTTVGGTAINLTVNSGTVQSITANAASIDVVLAAGSAGLPA